jgi:hypothetical protein
MHTAQRVCEKPTTQVGSYLEMEIAPQKPVDRNKNVRSYTLILTILFVMLLTLRTLKHRPLEELHSWEGSV